MDKINYTVTLDDCRDYVKYQLKIPRVRKFIMKAFFANINNMDYCGYSVFVSRNTGTL